MTWGFWERQEGGSDVSLVEEGPVKEVCSRSVVVICDVTMIPVLGKLRQEDQEFLAI